jgi:ferredoxin
LAQMPVIDTEKCNGCGLCITVCSCKILVMVENVISIVAKKECQKCTHWCTLCEDVCPTGAITCPFEIVIEDR